MDEGLCVSLRQEAPIPLDIELTCGPGELIALTGPSGGGKSTILRSIAGLYHPGHGRITSNGAVWFDTSNSLNLPAHRRSAGFVFQNYALFPHMDALGNVVAAMDHRARPERERRAADLLELMHLRGLERRRPAELSGGQQQRVALARAMARDPQALLLDEPFSAVDKSTRTALYEELRELRRVFRIPIILVTHDLNEAAELADHLCLVDRGKVIESGPPGDVLTRPLSARSARLVGLKNLSEARIVAHEGEHTKIEWDGVPLLAARRDEFSSGTLIAWSIPSTGGVLEAFSETLSVNHNTFHGVVQNRIPNGETVLVTMILDRGEKRLSATLPAHDDKLRSLVEGARVSAHLPARAVHLMSPLPSKHGDDGSREGRA